MAITSDYDYIAELSVDPTTGLYDLTLTTFNGKINVLNFGVFICQRKHACRLDLVSGDLYNDTKWTGSLAMLNDIMNIHSIRDGDVLFYLPVSDLQGLLEVPPSVSQTMNTVKNDLINILKKPVPDGSRANFLNNNSSKLLPPSVLPETAPQVVVNNAKIQISPNLFQNPTTTPTVASTPVTPPIVNSPQPTENVQLILVKKYIKLANG